MEPLGTCTGKFPDGRKCENPAPVARPTYVVINAQAFEPLLCPGCTERLQAMFLAGAPRAQWRKYPPTEAPDGSLWETTDVRRVLAAAGQDHLAKKGGPLRADARIVFAFLLEQIPDLAQRVRRGELFTDAELSRILGRVVENRQRDAKEERETVE